MNIQHSYVIVFSYSDVTRVYTQHRSPGRKGLFGVKNAHAELIELINMIYEEGFRYDDGTVAIPFGILFQVGTQPEQPVYNYTCDEVVGGRLQNDVIQILYLKEGNAKHKKMVEKLVKPCIQTA